MVGAVTMIFDSTHALSQGLLKKPPSRCSHARGTMHAIHPPRPPLPRIQQHFQRPCTSPVATLCRVDGVASIRAFAPRKPHQFRGGTTHQMQMHILQPDVPATSWRLPAAVAEPATVSTLPAAVALVVAGVTNRILCTIVCSPNPVAMKSYHHRQDGTRPYGHSCLFPRAIPIDNLCTCIRRYTVGPASSGHRPICDDQVCIGQVAFLCHGGAARHCLSAARLAWCAKRAALYG